MCRCCNYPWSCEGTPNNKARSALARRINSEGGWEEFHQKRGNSGMQYFHKSNRLSLQKEYDAKYGGKPYEPCQTPALCDSHATLACH